MKKKLIIFSLIVIAIMVIFIILKIINPPKETYSVCFAVGNTRNVMQFNTNILKDELDSAFINGSDYSLVIIDGNPTELSDSNTLTYPSRILDKDKNNQAVLDKHISKMLSFEPNDEEIDILTALKTASQSLDKKADHKKIVVYSSGISTKGDLDFLQNRDWLLEDPKEIVDLLKKQHALPDLRGIEVVWYGFNHVDDNQKKLNNFQYYKLKSLWLEILIESGAKYENINMIFNEKASTVTKDNLIDKTSFPNVSTVNFDDIIIFNDEDFAFIAKNANLQDKEKAIKTLMPIAEDIKNSGYPQFYIVGSTASIDSKEDCIRLSKDRANTIKKILCDLGIPKQCLKAYGIGREYIDDDYYWRINDMYSNGNLVPSLAQKNRKVMLIPVDSNSGNKFIEDYNEHFGIS